MRINRRFLVGELKERDIKIMDLSDMSGVSRQTISSVINGKTCSVKTAEKISKALNMKLEELTI